MFDPRKENILKIFEINKPPRKESITILISRILCMNVRALKDTKITAMKTINPEPSLLSTPQRLELISFESKVDSIREIKMANEPISKRLFISVAFPSHISLITSIPKIIVENIRITKDIPFSVQSHGNGIMERGRRNSMARNRYF